MVFRPWHADIAMSQDQHGIPIPAATEPRSAAHPDIVLLPLVAFDAHGYRLGYGGGYFDRTLAAVVPRPLAIGVGYELCRTESTCPQPHDVALDLMVTEAGVFYPPPAQKNA